MSTSATILIADDDRAIRTVLHQALGRQGHTVRSTGTAATLWQWVQEGEGQLVITDVVMPDENGLDLVPRIRKLRPDLRIIVMSAQSTLLTAVRATRTRRLRISAQAVRSQRAGLGGESCALGAGRIDAAWRASAGGERTLAADRAVGCHAGDLPRPGTPDVDRPHGDGVGRIGHRQGAGCAGAARLRQAPQGTLRGPQHGRHPARAD